MNNLILQRFEESLKVKSEFMSDEKALEIMEEMARAMVSSLADGGKVIFAGNGGSFADSIHLAAELVSRFTMERGALASVSLGANNSILTAVGNDYEFGRVFSRELEALGRQGDVFIGLSTSGNSGNVIACVRVALTMGLKVFALTGRSGGRLADLCTCLRVPSDVTARIQEVHITVGHILCELVEREMFT